MLQSPNRRGVATAIALLVGGAMLTAHPATAGTAAAPSECTPTWSAVTAPPEPANLSAAYVAGTSPNDVWYASIDNKQVASPLRTRMVRWDGHTLADAPTVPWGGADSQQLVEDIAFDSSRDGWAVGTSWPWGSKYVNHYQVDSPWTAHWTGDRWSVVPVPPALDATTTISQPVAVAAISPSDAWMVGQYHLPENYGSGGVLTQHWDGHRWSNVPNPLQDTPHAGLHGITAISSNDVWAVGQRNNADGAPVALAEHYDGSTWQSVDLPAGAAPSALESVSATGPDDVWVAGGDTTAGTNAAQPMVEHYDGSKWTVTDLPDLGNAELYGVYAAAPDDVWATEQTPVHATNQLIHYDGSTWSAVAWPHPAEYGLLNHYPTITGFGSDDIWAVAGVVTSRATLEADGGVNVAHLNCAGGTE